ncbi:hypothetical protein ACJX0J_019627, partial [Zea mays]
KKKMQIFHMIMFYAHNTLYPTYGHVATTSFSPGLTKWKEKLMLSMWITIYWQDAAAVVATVET